MALLTTEDLSRVIEMMRDETIVDCPKCGEKKQRYFCNKCGTELIIPRAFRPLEIIGELNG